MGNIGQANYAASKAGMLGLTKALAREAAHLVAANGTLTPDSIGLTVNAVTPGLVSTDMLDAVPPKVLDRMVAQIPMRRIGRSEDVARVVHFLAADAASYITGQVWAVNGGMDM
jgi:acetoacetyl-CoA reductase/3-oxoacyl-[acyl-carrier protein] reductase